MSKSYREDLWSYLSSRLLTLPMLALLLLLLSTAWIPSFPTRMPIAAIQILLAINLLAMFRLWDDLSDTATDRTTEPGRVLCHTNHLASFRWTCVMLGITTVSIQMSVSPKSGIGLILLTAAFSIYYQLPWRSSWPRLSYHLLIFKYPCFVALIGVIQHESISELHLMMMFAAYLILCTYEVAHDPTLRADAWCRAIAGIELFAATITAIWITKTLS